MISWTKRKSCQYLLKASAGVGNRSSALTVANKLNPGIACGHQVSQHKEAELPCTAIPLLVMRSGEI